jgi:O-antigen ligase
MKSTTSNPAGPFDFISLSGIILIVSALLFGGATRLDVLAPIVPRLVAIVILAAMLWRGQLGLAAWSRGERLIWAILFLVPLVQLIPLPYSLWSQLPGRDYARAVTSALDLQPWLHISLTGSATVNAVLALIPGFAAYALARQANERQVRTWLFLLFWAGLASATLGLFQVASGPESSLRFYAITNSDSAVGLFSNANHHASFLACCMLLAGYWLLERLANARQGAEATSFAIFLCAVAIMVAAVLFTFSRAGLGFVGVIMIAGTALAARQLELPRRAVVRGGILLLLLTAVALYFYFSNPAIADRMAVDIRDNGRLYLIPTFARIMMDYLPFGSGLGSFDPVFRAYETASELDYNYLNHAHNDYAQLLIEAGLFAAIGLALFLLWWARSAFHALRASPHSDRARVQAWVAVGGSAIFLLHSLADYPLRGAAVSVMFAIFCAIIARMAALRAKSRFE